MTDITIGEISMMMRMVLMVVVMMMMIFWVKSSYQIASYPSENKIVID